MNDEFIPLFDENSSGSDLNDLNINRDIVSSFGELYSTVFNVYENGTMNEYGGLPNPGGPGFTQGLGCDQSEPPGCNEVSYHRFCCTNKVTGCADPKDVTFLIDCESKPPYNQCDETGLCESIIVCNSGVCISYAKCEDGDTGDCFNDPRNLSWWQFFGKGCYFDY